jgi:hypothetical protein
MAEYDNREPRQEIFSKAVRAGKRTYFFDVKSTRGNDYYLTITESKRRFGAEGDKPMYEKHKIFLYREDFEKFSDGLNEVVNFIRESKGGDDDAPSSSAPDGNRFSDVDFDDLEEKP